MNFIKMKALQGLLIVMFLFAAFGSFAQIPPEIAIGFKRGDAKMISNYFNQNIELAVISKSNICSKSQARQILNKFFSENPTESFKILSYEMKKESKYIIAILNTANGPFRVYMLLKNTGKVDTIHLLKIEKKADE